MLLDLVGFLLDLLRRVSLMLCDAFDLLAIMLHIWEILESGQEVPFASFAIHVLLALDDLSLQHSMDQQHL